MTTKLVNTEKTGNGSHGVAIMGRPHWMTVADSHGISDKSAMRMCRIGHCGNPNCIAAFEARCAAAEAEEQLVEVVGGEVGDTRSLDEVVGFDVMATYLDYVSDCNRGICDHPECHHKLARRLEREPFSTGRSDQWEDILDEDGRINKKATRMGRLYGSVN
jgi:hypothetical protein